MVGEIQENKYRVWNETDCESGCCGWVYLLRAKCLKSKDALVVINLDIEKKTQEENVNIFFST